MYFRQKIKWLDPLTLSVLLMITGFVSALFLYREDKKVCVLGIVFMFLGGLIFIYQVFKGKGMILENHFQREVYFKPENGCDAKVLVNTPVIADGVNTGIYPGKVYKILNGVNVYIDEKGSVLTYSLISNMLNKGWVDKKFFGNDKCWLSLF